MSKKREYLKNKKLWSRYKKRMELKLKRNPTEFTTISINTAKNMLERLECKKVLKIWRNHLKKMRFKMARNQEKLNKQM